MAQAARVTQPRGKTRSRGGALTALRAPSVERRLTRDRQHAPGTPLCAAELRPTAAQRSLVQRSFVHNLSTASLITITHNNGPPSPPHPTAIPQ